MDIDAPPTELYNPSTSSSHSGLDLPTFTSAFPLPFRVLFLLGLAQLLWAINLHVLHLLGLDTARILDFRDDPIPTSISVTGGIGDDEATLEMNQLGVGLGINSSSSASPSQSPMAREVSNLDVGLPSSRISNVGGSNGSVIPSRRITSGTLYQPVYKLFCVYTAWVGGGWFLYRSITGGEVDAMERWRGLVGLVMLGAIVGAVTPWRGVAERERRLLLRAVRRIFLPPLDTPIFFCDVILADILTSFAKVLGDLYVSAIQIWFGGITRGLVVEAGISQWITLCMICLPYLLRFRQCLVEFYQSSWTSTRSLANALKYFSAFPVIFLSAAQGAVLSEVAKARGMSVQEFGDKGSRWFGEHPVFRLWLLAVVVNSMFSFYWDIQKDWGLALCEIDTWIPSAQRTSSSTISPMLGTPRMPTSTPRMSILSKFRRVLSTPTTYHQRSPCPTPNPYDENTIRSPPHPPRAFGLRQTLLLPDPIVYYLFAIIDFILRFTWSLKLSSHLHTIGELESGVFLMEALELVRRWMWVFIRVEWEAVKIGDMARARRERGSVIWEQEPNKSEDK